MKILAAAFASCFLLAAPALAQGDQGKPPAPAGSPADAAPEPAQSPPGTTADKPADTPEPTEAPEGTTPDKPADTPSH